MLSKRDKLFLAAAQLGCLACPSCGAALVRAGDDFACAKSHRVNVNRKGCLNVLSAQVDSCYDADLFAARRRVFDEGCYDGVVQAIESMLPAADHRILDAGCGDGWYLNALLSRHESWCGAGVDISEVNKLVKQFEQARKMMKQFGGMMGGKRKFGGLGGLGGGLKLPF